MRRVRPIPSFHRAFRALLAILLGTVASGCSSVRLAPAERAMWSTYPVATQKGMGTCFLVESEDPRAPGSTAPIVVTSLHVLKTVGKGALYLAARVPDGEGTPGVVILEARAPQAGKVFYVQHPSHDIAAFRLTVPDNIASLVPLPTYFSKHSIGRHQTKPGDDVSLLGFPDVLPGTPGVLPILRGARVASYSGGWYKQNEFLLHGDVFPGDSGGPVIVANSRGNPKLVGMIVQRLGPDAKRFVPLAIAVDAMAVRQTVDLLVEAERKEAKEPATLGSSRRTAMTGKKEGA